MKPEPKYKIGQKVSAIGCGKGRKPDIGNITAIEWLGKDPDDW